MKKKTRAPAIIATAAAITTPAIKAVLIPGSSSDFSFVSSVVSASVVSSVAPVSVAIIVVDSRTPVNEMESMLMLFVFFLQMSKKVCTAVAIIEYHQN